MDIEDVKIYIWIYISIHLQSVKQNVCCGEIYLKVSKEHRYIALHRVIHHDLLIYKILHTRTVLSALPKTTKVVCVFCFQLKK